jgi:hypothetical protein
MKDIIAAQNVFGPSTLVLTSLFLSLGLLAIRSYVHQLKIKTSKSSLLVLDTAIIGVIVIFFILVYLRFLYLA